jgi:glycine betaine/choline ABC-type transport system substrate-binding protein
MDTNEPFDYAGSLAVLIGISEYEDEQFTDLPAAANSFRGMRQVLTAPELCGWPPSQIKELFNYENSGQATVKLQKWAAQTTGTFLLYYVGHGTPSRNGPYLTLTDTKAEYTGATSVDYEDVRQALLKSPAHTKIVILDCCYAGRAIPLAQSGPDLFTDIKGTFVLAAADNAAHVPTDQELACTSFTGELLDLVRKGLTGGLPVITLDELYANLKTRLKTAGLPEPNRGNTDTAGSYRFTRNAALLPEPIARFPQPTAPIAVREAEPPASEPPASAASRWRSWRTWVSVALAVVVLAGVAAFTFKRFGASAAPCAQPGTIASSSDGTVVIGADSDVTEDLVLAYIYRDALRANDVSVAPTIVQEQRKDYYGQVCSGAITVVPEYNGALLTSSVDQGSTAISTTDVDNALDQDLPATLEVLNPAPAQDKDSLTVSRTLANRYGLKSIADLTRVAGKLILGAPATFDGREEGTAGIESTYGVDFTHFIPLGYGANSDAAVTALQQDEVQVADVYSTAPQIKTDHLVTLADPKDLFRADNVIPLVYKPAVQANQRIETVLNYVSSWLSQSQLEDLDIQAAAPDPDLQAIAKAWVQANFGRS